MTVLKNSVNFSILLIFVTVGDSCLEQRAGETPQMMKASWRLTGRPAESDRLQ